MLAVIAAIAAALGIALPGSGGSSSSAPGSTAPQPTVASASSGSTAASSSSPSTTTAPGGGTAATYPAEERGAVAATLHSIDVGTADRYPEDGETFQNREGHLPSEPLGYYREYTVETPGSPDRGTRRLVIGDQGETYYTNDHYNSFKRIDPEDFR